MAIVTQQTETNRIQQHLQAVEQQLRAKHPSLPPKQLEERVHNLDRLFGEFNSRLVRLSHQRDNRMLTLPRHGLGQLQDGGNRIKDVAIPVVF